MALEKVIPDGGESGGALGRSDAVAAAGAVPLIIARAHVGLWSPVLAPPKAAVRAACDVGL